MKRGDGAARRVPKDLVDHTQLLCRSTWRLALPKGLQVDVVFLGARAAHSPWRRALELQKQLTANAKLRNAVVRRAPWRHALLALENELANAPRAGWGQVETWNWMWSGTRVVSWRPMMSSKTW